MRSPLVLATAAFLTVLLAAPSTSLAQSDIIIELSDAEAEQLLEDMGYQVLNKTREDNYTEIKFQFGQYVAFLNNYRTSVQLSINFTDDLTMRQVNDWNKGFRFGHAWYSGENSFLDYDLELRGGVTRRNLEAYVRRFDSLVREFVTFLRDANR